MLVLLGCTVGFDSKVREAIAIANPNLDVPYGVWTFEHFINVQLYIADEQVKWETSNGLMANLLPGVPIGQIMDRILFINK